MRFLHKNGCFRGQNFCYKFEHRFHQQLALRKASKRVF